MARPSRPHLWLGALAVACAINHRVHCFAVLHKPHQRLKLCSSSCNPQRLSHSCPRRPPFARPMKVAYGRAIVSNLRSAPLLMSTTVHDAKLQDNVASAPSAEAQSKGPPPLVSASSLSLIVVADLMLKQCFKRAGLVFPASLAGMVALFAGFVGLEKVAPKSAENIVGMLEPGSALLARWLPVFFVPTLVILPLSPTPSRATALRLLVIVFGGWFLSLASTAAVVSALSKGGAPAAAGDDAVNPAAAIALKPAGVFRKKLVGALGIGALVAGATSVITFGSGRTLLGFSVSKLALPTRQLSLMLATLFGFSAGTQMPTRVRKAVHPVVTCTAVAMITAAVIGRGCAVGFADMLRSYVTKSRCPVHLGAGDLLLGLLGPSVLSFAVQMYRRRELIFKNAKPVAGGSFFCATSGLFGTAVASRLIGLPNALRLATLSRNITSPLAMAICSMLGADTSFAIAIVVVTGVIGANFGATALDALGVKDPAARGLAQGGSAHGLGTAAMVNEPTAFAFSAVAMAFTATASTVLVSIPAVRSALLTIALGASWAVPIP